MSKITPTCFLCPKLSQHVFCVTFLCLCPTLSQHVVYVQNYPDMFFVSTSRVFMSKLIPTCFLCQLPAWGGLWVALRACVGGLRFLLRGMLVSKAVLARKVAQTQARKRSAICQGKAALSDRMRGMGPARGPAGIPSLPSWRQQHNNSINNNIIDINNNDDSKYK